MEDSFILNNKVYSNNNNILFEVVNKMENIVNDLSNNSCINKIMEQIRNIIIILNSVIKKNKKNIDLIRKDFNNLRQDIINGNLKKNNIIFIRKKSFNEETKNHLKKENGIHKINSAKRFAVDHMHNLIEEERITHYINSKNYNNIEALFLTQNGRIIFRNGL